LEYLLIALVLFGIIAVIRSLTADSAPAGRREDGGQAGEMADAVNDLMGRSLATQAMGLHRRVDGPDLSDVLADLFDRLGLTQTQVDSQLDRLGLQRPDRVDVRKAEDQPFELRVSRRQDAVNDAVERGLLVGIHIAREEDDYARVGDDYADSEVLAQRVDAAEEVLFGSGRREALALLGKVSLALQDMLAKSAQGERADIVRHLLGLFDDQLKALQDEMATAMARVPDPNALRWGDSRDRRQYYFKMGVTNSLRRSGCLESLGRLYWLRGVNYDVTEAFNMAAEECPALAAAHLMDIDRLLALGPAEVRALVERALPEPNG